MKILIFDRRIETLSFLAKKIHRRGNTVVIAENGSKFIGYIVNGTKRKFDAILICKKELQHYNIDEKYLFSKVYNPLVVSSYLHCDDFRIKKIKIISSKVDRKKEIKTKQKLVKILKKCIHKNVPVNKIQKKYDFGSGEKFNIEKDFIYSLPKKTGILLENLIIKKEEGLSYEEITKLFWGKEGETKKNCIYNHIYNLRRILNLRFSNSYIIHKHLNRYTLIKLENNMTG